MTSNGFYKIFAALLSLTPMAHGSSRKSINIVQNLKSAGFICSTDTLGSICILPAISDSLLTYSQPIALLVPPISQNVDTTIIHFHGHRFGIPRDIDYKAILNDFDFRKQLLQINNQNAIFVMPMSRDKCSDYEQELAPQFVAFTKWLFKITKLPQRRLILTSHSGSYRTISQVAKVLASSQKSSIVVPGSIVFFDATYTVADEFFMNLVQLKTINPKLKFASIYRTATKPGSDRLAEIFQADRALIFPSEIDDHYALVNRYYQEIINLMIQNLEVSPKAF